MVQTLLDHADEQAELIAQVSPKLDKNQIALGVKGTCVILLDAIEQQKSLFSKGVQQAFDNVFETPEKK